MNSIEKRIRIVKRLYRFGTIYVAYTLAESPGGTTHKKKIRVLIGLAVHGFVWFCFDVFRFVALEKAERWKPIRQDSEWIHGIFSPSNWGERAEQRALQSQEVIKNGTT